MGSWDEFGTGGQNLRGENVSISFSRMFVLRACPFFSKMYPMSFQSRKNQEFVEAPFTKWYFIREVAAQNFVNPTPS